MLKLLLLLAACVWAKPIDISVEAPWRAPPETILALETLAEYNHSSFFPLLSVILSAREIGEPVDEIELLYNTAGENEFLTQAQLALASQEYRLGTVLPRFEQNYQQFEALNAPEVETCPIVMWTDGTVSCDRSDLYALQFTETVVEQVPGLTANDRVIGSGPQWIVLYADVDSPDFPEWHSALLALALEQKITYVLRYRPSATAGSAAGSTSVAGYGVGLHLKRTDYLVVDDRQLGGEKLQLNIDAPKQVPTSKVPFLSFGAAKKVRNHTGSDAEKLALLQDLSFNFPNHAAQLAASSSEADEEAEMLANPGGGLGANGLFINGFLIDKLDAYTFYDTLRKEELLLTALDGFLPEGTNIPEILVSGVALDSPVDSNLTIPKRRYDLRSTPETISWINDIEHDRPYRQLDPSISVLAESESPFAPIRRNVHTVVVAGSLEDRRTLALLASLFRLVGRQLPLQVGFVSDTPLWTHVARLGIDARQAFLVTLLRTQDSDEALQMAQLAHEEAGNPPKQRIGDAKKWLRRFGLDSDDGPSLFVNGFPMPVDDWQEGAMHVITTDAEQLHKLASSRTTVDMDGASVDLETVSLRDLLFSSGAPTRNLLVDPVKPAEFIPWPLSPMHLFTNPEANSSAPLKQSVLFSSSFSYAADFDLLDHLLSIASSDGTVEVAVRPLKGVDERFYATLLDKSFNMFRFSRDLVSAAKGHLFENKTPPKVFTAAAEPALPADELPDEPDTLIIDGRVVPLSPKMTVDVLDKLLEREAPRVQRLRERIPGINGVGVAALTASAQGRVQIMSTDVPDISIKSQLAKSSALTFVMNPGSDEAQELLGLANLARKIDLPVDIYLTPGRLESVPTRLYRGVFDRFEHARFDSDVVQDDTLYTVEVIEPNSWLTVASKCAYDLDNVVLNMVKEDELSAVYSLRSLLIEGYVVGPEAPGTRLRLLGLNGTLEKDTVVMANLGYFQLQAERPGIHYVCTADDEHAFYGYNTTSDCIPVPISSFSGATLRPGILKATAETQTAKSLLGSTSSDSSSSIWSKFGGLMGGKRSADTGKQPADVNIFTVASGHLYERFASIMMLSTMKHTTHSVKFWLIENFMSPKFKEFVPELAAAYGFDYEFVSYKWPSWLRAQTEKQRQIWGYKMLFLDVLFPQELSNVIFVDSDQIVRTDFKELIEMNLHGAPYAFTPMGDDREEMEPFRFWKQGYWKRVLLDHGLKYHISALYRVDLDRFRDLRVGDLMRHQYQQLSADPESLANLDQDLPNSMQHYVPIYSLPDNWLWCETWCSDESLAEAKTIDLCNNPLTKEPKLDRARRQISEWTEYDRAVAELQKQVDDAQKNKSQSALGNPKPSAHGGDKQSNVHKQEDLSEDSNEEDDDIDHLEL